MSSKTVRARDARFGILVIATGILCGLGAIACAVSLIAIAFAANAARGQ